MSPKHFSEQGVNRGLVKPVCEAHQISQPVSATRWCIKSLILSVLVAWEVLTQRKGQENEQIILSLSKVTEQVLPLCSEIWEALK